MAKMLPLDRIGLDSTPPWTVSGVVSGVTLLWGEPGMGKSFVAMSLAASVASGRPWLGHRTQSGPVVYIAGEGGAETVGHRLRTALGEWSVELEEEALVDVNPIYVVAPGVDLVPGPGELVGLLGDVCPRLIVVDTLSRCFVGDENKQDEMGKFVRSLDLLREHYGCDLLVVHHANKKHELRGSSVLFGAVDVSWHLTKASAPPGPDAKALVMRSDKLRERSPESGQVRMRAVAKVIVGANGSAVYDELGDRQTTLVIKPSKADLHDAEVAKNAAMRLLEKKAVVTYADWSSEARMDKARFDNAVSFVITYPGHWGIMKGVLVGTFERAVAGVENEWV